jgi:hypothetical protein
LSSGHDRRKPRRAPQRFRQRGLSRLGVFPINLSESLPGCKRWLFPYSNSKSWLCADGPGELRSVDQPRSQASEIRPLIDELKSALTGHVKVPE